MFFYLYRHTKGLGARKNNTLPFEFNFHELNLQKHHFVLIHQRQKLRSPIRFREVEPTTFAVNGAN